MAIILITHDLGIVANFAQHIIVMYAGTIVETGTAKDIFYHAAHPYTKALLNAVPRLDAEEDAIFETIEGTPPDMINPPNGCPFAARCSKCMPICVENVPPETEIGVGHKAKCWHCVKEVQQ